MTGVFLPVYQAQQIRQIEELAQKKLHLSGDQLMQRAGQAAFGFMMRRWPDLQRIAVFCGGGNNGGDGYALAKLIHDANLDVAVYQVAPPRTKEAINTHKQCVAARIPITVFSPEIDLSDCQLVVDAISGIGARGALRQEIVDTIDFIQQTGVPIFAIDVPTGVEADTGYLLSSHALKANATLTFIGLKLGLLTGHGIAYTGELALNDLQLPEAFLAEITPVAKRLQLNDYLGYLPARRRDWHKGLAGHVLIVGGDLGYSGAPRMAGQAALRVGSGLVSIAAHPQNAVMMNADCPELMCHGIDVEDKLIQLLQKATTIILGPGLGLSVWSKNTWEVVMKLAGDKPMVVDGDGLNWLAKNPIKRNNWILTPHPGEAARLLQSDTETIQKNRFAALEAITKKYGGVCVLKGAGTFVSAPDIAGVCDCGNPGMATAGMGDILSGVIGSLLGQGVDLNPAAELAVCLHAVAGDAAAKEGERGMIATDLLPQLRRLVNVI